MTEPVGSAVPEGGFVDRPVDGLRISQIMERFGLKKGAIKRLAAEGKVKSYRTSRTTAYYREQDFVDAGYGFAEEKKEWTPPTAVDPSEQSEPRADEPEEEQIEEELHLAEKEQDESSETQDEEETEESGAGFFKVTEKALVDFIDEDFRDGDAAIVHKLEMGGFMLQNHRTGTAYIMKSAYDQSEGEE